MKIVGDAAQLLYGVVVQRLLSHRQAVGNLLMIYVSIRFHCLFRYFDRIVHVLLLLFFLLELDKILFVLYIIGKEAVRLLFHGELDPGG